MISRRAPVARPWWRRALVVLLVVGGSALAARVLLDSSDELFAAADDLTDLTPGWVVAAFVAEAFCYLARGAAQRTLLVSGTSDPDQPDTAPARVGTLVLAGTTLAGDAVAYCLPLGFAAAGVVTLRVLRRRAVGAVVAGWMFGVATLLYVAVLAVLGIVAAQLAGDDGPAGLQGVSAVLLGALLVVLAVVLAARRWSASPFAGLVGWASRRGRSMLRWIARDGGRAGSRPAVEVVRGFLRRMAAAVASWWAQVRLLRLTAGALAVASVGMLASWAADIGVLAASYAALGAVPPWTGLLLAYCAGQIVSSVPLTPGGIGVVEGSLTLALVAFGGSTETTLAAVLLYRLISHWACIPAGGLAWLALRLTEPTRDGADAGAREPATVGAGEGQR